MEDIGDLFSFVSAVISLCFDIGEESGDEGFDEYFFGPVKGLPSIGDKFADDSIVFSSAGFRVIFSEVVHFAADADESPVGRFMAAVFGKLFSFVGHKFPENKSVNDTFYHEFNSETNENICS